MGLLFHAHPSAAARLSRFDWLARKGGGLSFVSVVRGRVPRLLSGFLESESRKVNPDKETQYAES